MKDLQAIYQTEYFAVLSLSYEKADAETRGKFAFFENHIKDFVQDIKTQNLGDAFVVSTCNRTEVYTTTPDYLEVASLFCKSVGVETQEFLQYVNILTKQDALNHLFRVAGGLESQILGDFEIIGQIKNAYHRFKKEKSNANPYLERAINTAIQISKKIKNKTGLSNGAASVSYAAVHYILTQQKQISEKNILLLGVGEIGQNTVENLIKHVPNPKVKIANRSLQNAEKISKKFHIPPIDFQDFPQELKTTDILIVATGAAHPIINKSHFPNGKKTLVIDLSIPHNVEKDITENPNIQLVDIDYLSQHIQSTLENRKKEIPKAEKMIIEMMEDFLVWEKKRKTAPNIHQFKNALDTIEKNELHKIHKKYRYAAIEDMELSNKVIQKITNRFAKYMIDNPEQAESVSNLLYKILIEQPKNEYDENH